MSGEDQEQTSSEDVGNEEGSEDARNEEGHEEDSSSETPELSEEGKENVKRMAEAYQDRETAVLPGTDNTITGTAVNEWLDDEGNPKFGKEEQEKKEQQEDHDQPEDEQANERQQDEQKADQQQDEQTENA